MGCACSFSTNISTGTDTSRMAWNAHFLFCNFGVPFKKFRFLRMFSDLHPNQIFRIFGVTCIPFQFSSLLKKNTFLNANSIRNPRDTGSSVVKQSQFVIIIFRKTHRQTNRNIAADIIGETSKSLSVNDMQISLKFRALLGLLSKRNFNCVSEIVHIRNIICDRR